MICVGCQAHWLNLVSKDLLADNTVIDKVSHIMAWFSRNSAAHAGLRARQLPLPPMPGDTRWSSHYEAVEWYNKNWGAHVEIAASLLRPGEQVRRDLENVQVRRGAEDLHMQLKPVAKALDRMQAQNCTLADATDIWVNLLGEFPQQFKGAAKKVRERSTLPR